MGKRPNGITLLGQVPAETLPEIGDEVPLIDPADVIVTTYSLTLSSGRPASVGMPVDATDREWLDLYGIIASQVRPEHIRRQTGQSAEVETPIFVPSHKLVRA